MRSSVLITLLRFYTFTLSPFDAVVLDLHVNFCKFFSVVSQASLERSRWPLFVKKCVTIFFEQFMSEILKQYYGVCSVRHFFLQFFLGSFKYFGVWYAALFWCADRWAIEGFDLQLSRGAMGKILTFYTALLLVTLQSCTST